MLQGQQKPSPTSKTIVTGREKSVLPIGLEAETTAPDPVPSVDRHLTSASTAGVKGQSHQDGKIPTVSYHKRGTLELVIIVRTEDISNENVANTERS